jgi:peptide/nickel transport system ATP-binding protein
MSAILEIAGLSVALRGGGLVLHEIDITVAPGEVHGLVGESGAGKTMIGRAVLGLLPAAARIASGAIRFGGTDLAALSPAGRRRILGRELALIPQDPLTGLNPSRRIGAQMEDALARRIEGGRAALKAAALALLEEVHIREPARTLGLYPHELSGGMRQRVLIAMAFGVEPRLIVADEPTTALDVTVQRQILRLIAELRARHGTALLFVTHDLGVVAQICDRMTVLQAGRIVERGPVASVLDAPQHPYTRALFAATPRLDAPELADAV